VAWIPLKGEDKSTKSQVAFCQKMQKFFLTPFPDLADTCPLSVIIESAFGIQLFEGKLAGKLLEASLSLEKFSLFFGLLEERAPLIL
jgi:hypothetical protein